MKSKNCESEVVTSIYDVDRDLWTYIWNWMYSRIKQKSFFFKK